MINVCHKVKILRIIKIKHPESYIYKLLVKNDQQCNNLMKNSGR